MQTESSTDGAPLRYGAWSIIPRADGTFDVSASIGNRMMVVKHGMATLEECEKYIGVRRDSVGTGTTLTMVFDEDDEPMVETNTSIFKMTGEGERGYGYGKMMSARELAGWR